jgi:hypothetical protein
MKGSGHPLNLFCDGISGIKQCKHSAKKDAAPVLCAKKHNGFQKDFF